MLALFVSVFGSEERRLYLTLMRRVCDGPRMCPAKAVPKMCSAEAPDGRKKGNSAIMKSFCPYTNSDANKPQSERYTTRALQ